MFILEQLRDYATTGRVAFRYGAETMSYAQLDARSDAFAAWLLETLGDDRTPVVLYGHKELSLPACMFGCIKAGRAYVPVDTTFPADRVARILEQVQPKVLVDLRGLGLAAPVALDGAALDAILRRPAAPTPETWVKPETWSICSSPPAPPASPRRADHGREHRGLPGGRRAPAGFGLGRRRLPQ